MSVASISFLLQIIPCDTSITCNYEALSQAFYSEELGDHVDLILLCIPFFSTQSTFQYTCSISYEPHANSAKLDLALPLYRREN